MSRGTAVKTASILRARATRASCSPLSFPGNSSASTACLITLVCFSVNSIVRGVRSPYTTTNANAQSSPMNHSMMAVSLPGTGSSCHTHGSVSEMGAWIVKSPALPWLVPEVAAELICALLPSSWRSAIIFAASRNPEMKSRFRVWRFIKRFRCMSMLPSNFRSCSAESGASALSTSWRHGSARSTEVIECPRERSEYDSA
mmetsp:Transcript_7969/g.19381  ORF Transcript_7969/g.19381 Transcript_7969/m.19381 type:complete len:201 (-) Transcript_7969:149-751(-)